MLRALLLIALTGCNSASAPEQRPAETAAPAETTARPTGPGSDLIGTQVAAWQLSDWTNSEPLTLAELRGKVVFVRFWTNTCPYCAESMPAIQKLAGEFADKPVVFVGVYHSKPRGTERNWADAVELSRNWGVTFPIAYDHGWKTVSSWWLSGPARDATSASFVIDRGGKFSFVHPGPVFTAGDQDYQAIRRAIATALDASSS